MIYISISGYKSEENVLCMALSEALKTDLLFIETDLCGSDL